MTRPAIRNTLLVLAAPALVAALANSPASAHKAWHCANFRMEIGGLPSQPETPTGVAVKKGPQEPSTNRQFTRMIVKKLDKVRR
jgi:hypothetical protein